MRLPLLLLLLCTFMCFSTYATHIVGGEFELSYNTGNTYRLTLNLYYDEVNGDPNAVDNTISVSIYEKGSNRLMTTLSLPRMSRSNVPYTNIECTTGELRTAKVVYFADITLDPSRFSRADGYYVAYERCCRNRTINNIIAPEDAAQTFYMEFPPVSRNGRPFRNSSPQLFPPLSDYACQNELFYFDFSGTDADGDSLAYEMVTPLNGYSNRNNPAPAAGTAPYPTIRWLTGYNTANQILGSPAMNIDSQTGRLTVNPASKGLYVFGIRVSEYRNKVKIGEVRRDFQLLVKECPRNVKPTVLAKESGKSNYYQNSEVIRFKEGVRCIDVFYTDTDQREPLVLIARPVNFSSSDYSFSGAVSGTINNSTVQDTLKATLCFNECFDTAGKVYLMDLIVRDDGCSLPKLDTLRVSFVIDPVINDPPNLSLSTPTRIFNVKDGDLIKFDVTGADPDNQSISLSAAGKGFNITDQSITFQNKNGQGPLSSPFTWQIDCNALQQESYQIEFTVTSELCGKPVSRTELIEVRPIYENKVPVISSDKTVSAFTLELDKPFEANIFGKDVDFHQLELSAEGDGFTIQSLGMDFNSTGGEGEAKGLFRWTPTCEAAKRGITKVKFFLKESACIASPDQVLEFEFTVNAPNNDPTILTDREERVFVMDLDQPFEAKLFGEDVDQDMLVLAAEGQGFNLAELGMTFNSTSSAGKAEGIFKWVANCEAFKQGDLKVKFVLNEGACNPAEEKSIIMEFKVKVPDLTTYVPSNIFTPNGDGLNDYFEIPTLPGEFCTATFKNIRIFNRWGKEVFISEDNTFKWNGKGVNDGVYFYVIDFNTTTYKGSVTLVR